MNYRWEGKHKTLALGIALHRSYLNFEFIIN